MDTSDFAFSMNLPFKKKCQLPDCKRISNHISRVTIDNNVLDFCCSQHALVGKNRWEEKKKLGIRPGVPTRVNPIEEQLGENVPEGGEYE